MPIELCHEIPGLSVKLERAGPGNFTVTYGKQVKTRLNYSEAASEYGSCIMHALACDGLLDNRTADEARREDIL